MEPFALDQSPLAPEPPFASKQGEDQKKRPKRVPELDLAPLDDLGGGRSGGEKSHGPPAGGPLLDRVGVRGGARGRGASLRNRGLRIRAEWSYSFDAVGSKLARIIREGLAALRELSALRAATAACGRPLLDSLGSSRDTLSRSQPTSARLRKQR